MVEVVIHPRWRVGGESALPLKLVPREVYDRHLTPLVHELRGTVVQVFLHSRCNTPRFTLFLAESYNPSNVEKSEEWMNDLVLFGPLNAVSRSLVLPLLC